MAKNNKIKLYSQFFQALSLYMEIDFQDCKDWMLAYLKKNNPDVREFDMEKRVNKWWWDESRIIQEKYLNNLDGFFQELTEKQNKVWKSEWITTKLLNLELDYTDEHDTALADAVWKVLEPNTTARLFRDVYSDTSLLSIIEEQYSHQYFYIYRVHSKGKVFVRDLLRIQGHDGKGNIFCNLYQYTEHELPDQKYPNVRIYSGNVIFNTNVLDISLVCDCWVDDQGLRFSKIILPRIKENKFRNGIMTGLSDHGNNPVSALIVVTRAAIDHPIKDNEMDKHVKPLSEKEELKYHDDILINISHDDAYIEAKNLG